MDSKELDQFFLDRLSRIKRSPNPQSWDRIQARLDKKSKIFYSWRVAAAIVLLILVTSIYKYDFLESKIQTFSMDISQPEALTKYSTIQENQLVGEKELVEKKEEKKQYFETLDQQTQRNKNYTSMLIPTTITKESLEKTEKIMPYIKAPVVMAKRVNLIPELVLIFDLDISQKEDQFDIQTTYIASNDMKDKSVLKKFWYRAMYTEPSEVWSSIRATKDDFFRMSKNN